LNKFTALVKTTAMKPPTLIAVLSSLLLSTAAADAMCTQEGLQCLNLHYTSADVGAVISCVDGKYAPTEVCSPEDLCIEEPIPHCGPKNGTDIAMGTILPPTSTFADVPTSTSQDNRQVMEV
jgi:hypothetical protein